MNTIECIKTRSSIRKFSGEKIPEKTIRAIIEAATHAPSSGNVQDWEFIVVQNPETRKKLAEAAYNQNFINEAPVVIVVCTDIERIKSSYGERGISLYSIQNTAAAIQNLLLASNEYGLGTCWVGAFNERLVKDILILPTKIRPVAIIPVGYPAEMPRKTPRRKLEEVLHWERW